MQHPASGHAISRDGGPVAYLVQIVDIEIGLERVEFALRYSRSVGRAAVRQGLNL
jgi:hypothetical protein